MAYPRNNESNDNDQSDWIDPVFDQSNGVELDDSSSSNSMEGCGVGSASRGGIGIEERLTEIFVDERDGDLLLQLNNREERVMQWLQALDMQVMGACRTDERLKPLLKMNASNGVAEDRLLAHLSKYFEPVEVGMLARCFCIPLVSIRVGKIKKQGNLMSPTAARGNLNLTIMPTSDLRLSFIGDDGCIERLLTLRSKAQCSAVTIREMSSDPSKRSFLIKTLSGEVFYFWCSEKSKLLGVELLAKIQDILMRKPSVAELTGISESRLEYFVTHLRSFLVGSTVGGTATGPTGSRMCLDSTYEQSDSAQDAYLSTSPKSLQSQQTGNHSLRTSSPFQGSLSPRSSSFKEGLPRNLNSLRNAAREKLRQCWDNHFTAADNLATASSATNASSALHIENDQLPEVVRSCSLPHSCFLDSLDKLAGPPPLSPASQVPTLGTSFLSPYYCWCAPCAEPLQRSSGPPQPAMPTILSPLLPPLSSLLPVTMPYGLLTKAPPLNMVDCPSVHFPVLVSDSFLNLSRPTQQIPRFTPLMCDSIVHIPVIGVCSSGQGYLVSAGPSLSTTIPPLHSQLVNPLIPKADSVGEKGARETLRLLMSGSGQTNPPLMDVFPAVLTHAVDGNSGVLVAGSRGLYGRTRDVHAIASSIAAISLESLSGRPEGQSSQCSSHPNFDAKQEGSSVMSSIFCGDKEDAMFSEMSKERTDP